MSVVFVAVLACTPGRAGARFAAWTEEFDLEIWTHAFEGIGDDLQAIASEEQTPGEPLPWSHISSGVTETFLESEREAAMAGRPTPDCSFEQCSSCGVCSDLGVDVVVQGERRA